MRRVRIGIAAILLGVGFGALFEGIVLREILQWHGMVSNRVPMETFEALQINQRANGWFHLLLWLVAFAGIWNLWSAIRAPGRVPSARAFAGNLLLGWGCYNLVEGAINHFVLELHHVRDVPIGNPVYDWVLLAGGGIGFILLGFALRDAPDPGPVRDERRSGYDRRDSLTV
jgi:uncharacterized membrane protein